MTRLYPLHKNRIHLVSFLFLLINIIILSRMFFIQSFKSAELKSNAYEIGIIERPIKKTILKQSLLS